MTHVRWLLVILWAAGCAGGVEDNLGSGAPLQGGAVDNGHPAVGLVWFAGGGFCTGTLIASDVVLTAGHCVLDKVESFYTGTGSPTTNPGAPPPGMVAHPVAAQVPHPGYSQFGGCPNTTFDLGLLRLSAPLAGIEPILINQGAPPAANTTCTAVGFGTHNEGTAVTYEQKRAGTEIVQSLAPTSIEVKVGTALADHGDSGGPLICNGTIAGATSCHTDGDWPAHKLEQYARVDTAAAWIQTTIDGWHGAGGGTTGGGTTCAHPICNTGGVLTSGCDTCAAKICAADGYCCSTAWDSTCVNEVASICGQSCGGGGTTGGGTTGGGTTGGGTTGGGTTGGGGATCAHPICSSGGVLTSSCDPCAAKICAADSYCCSTSWDSTCVNEVASICGQSCGGGAGGCAHPICSAGGVLKSSCDPCAAEICAADSYCCSTAWDSTCVKEVASICGQSC